MHEYDRYLVKVAARSVTSRSYVMVRNVSSFVINKKTTITPQTVINTCVMILFYVQYLGKLWHKLPHYSQWPTVTRRMSCVVFEIQQIFHTQLVLNALAKGDPVGMLLLRLVWEKQRLMWLAGLIQATSVTDGWTDEQNAHSINLYRARTALHGKNSRSHINTEPDGESVVGSTMALCHGPTVGPTPLRGPALRQLIVAKKTESSTLHDILRNLVSWFSGKSLQLLPPDVRF